MSRIKSAIGSRAPVADGQCLADIVQDIKIAVSRRSASQELDAHFDNLSIALMDEIKNQQWSSRPRTWYVLHEMNRLDTMTAFIYQGLNDTSLPHRRDSLPETLNADDAQAFLELQELIPSDILHLEKGKHVTLKNGDVLFEKRTQKLGYGSQGTTVVDRVTSKATGRVYARKRISRKIFGHDRNAQKVYQNEIKVLSKIENQAHLIRVVGSYTDSKYFAMILEPVADKSLKDFLDKGDTQTLDEDSQRQLQTYFGCLAHTIGYLHGIEMLHKDVKPENVLLKNGRLILTDFGTAFDWSKTGQSMTSSNANDGRTPRYQSPEVAIAGEFHRSSDIWSLGVVFLEITTVLRGKSLREMNSYLESQGTKKTAIHENLETALTWSGLLRASRFGSFFDNEALAWIQKMLNRTFSTRPTAVELFDEISDFQDGLYCGRCCQDQPDFDGVSDSDGGILSSLVKADEVDDQRQVDLQPQVQDQSLVASETLNIHVFEQDYVTPEAFPLLYETVSEHVEAPSFKIRAHCSGTHDNALHLDIRLKDPFLLEAPSFIIKSSHRSGTHDNSLHLAIRLKDTFLVDAILEMMKSKKYSSYRLLEQSNGSGFTPLLLAFSVFNFSENEAEDLRIIKLLLEYGANVDEREKENGDTPLHRVVREIRNPIALELLCRHSANPRLFNEAGERPLDLIPKSYDETISDDWFLFADRRMRNALKPDDFRPPELIEYLDEESADRADHVAKASPGR